MPEELHANSSESLNELFKESKIMQLHAILSSTKVERDGLIFNVDDVKARGDSLLQLRETCVSDDGWVLQKESHEVRTLYQHHPSRPHLHSIRLEGIVDAPVFCLLALLHEVDLFHKWLPSYSFLGLNFAKCVSHPSPTELLIHLNINVPWPFSNRYVFFLCDGIDCMDDDPKQIGVIMNNLTTESDFDQVDDAVKTTFYPTSGILLTPTTEGKTNVQIIVHVDPQIAIVPTWLVDFAVRNLGYLIIVAIRNAVEIVKADPEYHKRMADKENPFYTHIRRRISESIPTEVAYISKFL